jgi:transcriptional antiterminator NusG
MSSNDRHWYVIHTYSGQELRVKENIEQKIGSMKLDDKIFNVIIPEMKDRKNVSKKAFPGYVLVEMILDDNIWYEIKNTTGVTGFIGNGKDALPLSEKEVMNIIGDTGVFSNEVEEITWEVGQKVKVMEGPFSTFIGEIKNINKEKKTAQILLKIFGRETSVELQYNQIEEAR